MTMGELGVASKSFNMSSAGKKLYQNKSKRSHEAQSETLEATPPDNAIVTVESLNSSSKKKCTSMGTYRKGWKPFSESFVGTIENFMAFVDAIIYHSSNCSGQLVFRRRDFKTHGLAFTVSAVCAYGSQCACAHSGHPCINRFGRVT